MSNDIYKGSLFNDGGPLDTGDLNGLRDYVLARQLDQVLRHRVGCLGNANDPDQYGSGNLADTMLQNVAYTVTGGECALRKGSANNKVSVSPGTLLAYIASPDGNAPQLVAYTVAPGEVDITIADGATNFRVDLLQVKLEWVNSPAVARDFEDASTRVKSSTSQSVTRVAQATWSVKQGTANATPTYPTPDAGYVAVGAIYVGVSYTNASAVAPMWQGRTNGGAFLVQLTMPLGVECHSVYPKDFDYQYAANWARGTDGAAQSSGAATDLRVWCPVGGTTKRVVAIELLGTMVSTDSVKLRHSLYIPGAGLTSVTPVYDLSSIMGDAAPNFGKFAHLGQIADHSSISVPAAAHSPVGDPCWAGGSLSGPAQRYEELGTSGPGSYPTEAHLTRAYLEINGASGSLVYGVRWWLAG